MPSLISFFASRDSSCPCSSFSAIEVSDNTCNQRNILDAIISFNGYIFYFLFVAAIIRSLMALHLAVKSGETLLPALVVLFSFPLSTIFIPFILPLLIFKNCLIFSSIFAYFVSSLFLASPSDIIGPSFFSTLSCIFWMPVTDFLLCVLGQFSFAVYVGTLADVENGRISIFGYNLFAFVCTVLSGCSMLLCILFECFQGISPTDPLVPLIFTNFSGRFIIYILTCFLMFITTIIPLVITTTVFMKCRAHLW